MVRGVLQSETVAHPQLEYSHLFKMIIVGQDGVGKSSLLSRFCKNSFNAVYNATIGVDFSTKHIRTADGSDVKLQVWDTAGQERFRVMSRSYYRGAHGVFLVFAVTDEPSFRACDPWYQEMKQTTMNDCQFVLVGTMIDLECDRTVSREQAQSFADEHDMTYFEVSSKTGADISRPFEELTEQMLMNAIPSTRQTFSTMPAAIMSKTKMKKKPKTDPSPNEQKGQTKSKTCTII